VNERFFSGEEQEARDRRARRLLLLLGVVLLFAFAADVLFGSVALSPGQVLASLFRGGAGMSPEDLIVLRFRLPRALTALLAGSALAVAGLSMQTLFANPLAGPFVLGVDAGASLGVALVLLAADLAGPGLGARFAALGGVAAASWAGSLAVLLLILVVASRVRSGTVLLILGLMFGQAVNSLVTVLLHFSSAQRAHGYLAWSFGSFSSTSWPQVAIMALGILPALLAGYFLTKPLNALLLGERYARTLGVPVERVRMGLIGVTAFLSGSVTAFCGPIAFLGIATPHLCRGLLRCEDHRLLLPACIAAGGGMALAADMLSHAPGSALLLPVNAVTSLLGAPVVVWVVLRRRGGTS